MARGALATGGEVVRERGLRWGRPARRRRSGAALPACAVAPGPRSHARGMPGARCGGRRVAGPAGWSRPGSWRRGSWRAASSRGWQPHWMAIDLAHAPADAADPRVSLVEVVPEYDGYGQGLMALARARPRRLWHAIARVDGAYAGHAWAHVVGGRLGGAGVYDVDVAPQHRRTGPGGALTGPPCAARPPRPARGGGHAQRHRRGRAPVPLARLPLARPRTDVVAAPLGPAGAPSPGARRPGRGRKPRRRRLRWRDSRPPRRCSPRAWPTATTRRTSR